MCKTKVDCSLLLLKVTAKSRSYSGIFEMHITVDKRDSQYNRACINKTYSLLEIYPYIIHYILYIIYYVWHIIKQSVIYMSLPFNHPSSRLLHKSYTMCFQSCMHTDGEEKDTNSRDKKLRLSIRCCLAIWQTQERLKMSQLQVSFPTAVFQWCLLVK